ncbi:histidine phosphatase family protein [Winogradskyella sp. 3972H.M.0a.05]|uniref:SixA phosphatase family protein n=1 Tax=Winogradskyella sp. 3972H.M.0a.05 TaxID=2950277 RepID=UPI003398805E
MKYIFTLFLCALFALPTFGQETSAETETTTYYFIRHAEKDRSDKTNRDPHLTEAGKKRAEDWSKILSHIKFDIVYSTNYNRTKETAQPTADKNNLEITLYDPRNIDGKAFMSDTKGKTVLVVGHSNTTPMFVNGVLGAQKYPQMDDNNNGSLYIVTVAGDTKVDQLLEIN